MLARGGAGRWARALAAGPRRLPLPKCRAGLGPSSQPDRPRTIQQCWNI